MTNIWLECQIWSIELHHLAWGLDPCARYNLQTSCVTLLAHGPDELVTTSMDYSPSHRGISYTNIRHHFIGMTVSILCSLFFFHYTFMRRQYGLKWLRVGSLSSFHFQRIKEKHCVWATYHWFICVLLELHQPDSCYILHIHITVSALRRISVQIGRSGRRCNSQRFITVNFMCHYVMSLK